MMPDEAMKILNIEKTALNKELIESQYKKFYSANDPAKVYYYNYYYTIIIINITIIIITGWVVLFTIKNL